jgi:hypothetical protein
MAAPGRTEQAGDLGYRRVAVYDVAHGSARGFVSVLAMISWSGTCWLPRWATGHRTDPGTRRPRVRTTLADAALAGFGLAWNEARSRRAGRSRRGRGLTGTVPTTPPGSNVVTLSAVDGGANSIPLGLPAGPN